MRWSALLLGIAAVAVVVVSAPVAAPPTETRYVVQLRTAAAQVATSYNELRALKANDPTLTAAGTRLGNAAAAACRTLRAYQRATFRFGTDEEYRLVRMLQAQLKGARVRYGSLTGVSLPAPTKKQVSAAEQFFRDAARAAAAQQVGRWVSDERLGEILTAGSVKQVKAAVTKELTRRINAAARSFSQRAIGLSLSLDSPLNVQLRLQAEQAVLTWLSRVAFHWDPTGLVVRIVGAPIVRFLRTELKELFRDHKHVVVRTDRTVNGFQSRIAELQKLLDNADRSRLASVERSLTRAEQAIDATVYLKSDLRKQGRTDLIARLTRAQNALVAKMRQTRQDFLLDSKLANANLRQFADNTCKLQAEILKIAKQAKAKPAPSTGGAGTAPTAAVCVPKSIRIQYSNMFGVKLGEYDASFQGLVKKNEYSATCVWVTPSGPTDEAFVATIEWIPDGVQGALPSGACTGRKDSPPWYHSRKRYLTVSGGPRKYYQEAVAGNETILKGVLAAAEAAGVGKPCK